jgi:transposase
MLFADNIGSHLSIDEVALSKEELYTIESNKSDKGTKGTLVACIAGTKAETIIKVLKKLAIEKRILVKGITLDIAPNMALAAEESFPLARLATDRFHVTRLALESVQQIRTQFRWQEMDVENELIKNTKKQKIKYSPQTLSNGDTPKQLLARSRYVLAKKESQWTVNQQERAQLLFERYPSLQQAYKHVIKLRAIYKEKHYIHALSRLKKWVDDTRKLKIKHFNSVANSIENHFETILNIFYQRSTNTNAESFKRVVAPFQD